MEFSSAGDLIEDYCLVLYVCTNDNCVWGKGPLRGNSIPPTFDNGLRHFRKGKYNSSCQYLTLGGAVYRIAVSLHWKHGNILGRFRALQ